MSTREQTRPRPEQHIELIPGFEPGQDRLPDDTKAAEETKDVEERRTHQGWFFVEWQCDRRCG